MDCILRSYDEPRACDCRSGISLSEAEAHSPHFLASGDCLSESPVSPHSFAFFSSGMGFDSVDRLG